MTRHVRTPLLVLVSLLWLVPSYLVVVNAFTPARAYTGTPRWLPAGGAFFSNVAAAFAAADIGQAMVNSAIYSVLGGGIAVLIAALASFAVVVMPCRHPAVWFWAIYTGTILPLQVFLSPLFSGYARTSLYDTQYGMLLIYVVLAVPFAFFVVRNYFTAIPRTMFEAASLDGAGWLRMFVQVHLPLARSALAAAFIFQFTATWNDLLFGITLTASPNTRPVMATLAELSGTYSTVGPPAVLAGALVASLPTLVVFFAFQRVFTGSLRLG